MSFHKILCPIDFSDGAHEAMLAALDLAREAEGEVTLLHVYSPPVGYADVMGPSSESAVLAVQEAVENEMGRWKAEAQATGVTIESRLAMGGAGPEILHAAKSGHYDLVVMGTHGRGGLKRFLLGSVAEKVVRRSPIPVMTLHAHLPAPGHAQVHP